MSILYPDEQYSMLEREKNNDGGYLKDDTYLSDSVIENEGEFNDLRIYGVPYILCNTSYPSCEVASDRSITEESLYRFDNIADFIDFTRWQPLAGTIRFYAKRHFPIEPATIYNIKRRGNYYTIFYSDGQKIIGYERYKPTGYFSDGSGYGYTCYDRAMTSWPEGVAPPPNFPYYIEEYLFPMTLENTSITREFGPKSKGYLFYKVTRKWKTMLFDTDIEDNKITPDTPPWMKRVDSVRISSETVEEAVEKVYPDMTTNGIWQDMLNTASFFGATQDEILEAKIKAAKHKYATRIKFLDKHKEDGAITAEGYKNEVEKAKKTFEAEKKLAYDEYDGEKAATDVSSSGIVFTDEGRVDKEKMYVPFVNSAGVNIEATKTREILRIEFSYNAPSFDFSAPVRFKNKVNDREIKIAGTEYKARSVLISDLGAEFKREYNEDGSIKWEYWTINVVLCVDDQTYNKDYANLGTHVIEKTEYWVGETATETKFLYREKAHRIGSGPRAGEVVSQERLEELKLDSSVGTAEVKRFSRDPSDTDFAPRLDSEAIVKTGNSEKDKQKEKESKSKYPIGNVKMSAEEAEANKDFIDAVDGKYALITRYGLAKIYHCDGHYYTKRQLDLQRTDGEHEVVDEPMFLSKDGMALSPFYENGKQVPVYLRGCIHKPVDFSELGIPEVS